MVVFKYGRFGTKRYDHLCPKSKIHIKTGKYIFKPRENSLMFLDGSCCFENIYSLPFYINLDVDFGRLQDNCIPLVLDRRGIFHRVDAIFGQATIDDLFYKYDEEYEGRGM